jgi:D-amino-acid dehydrogenase
MTASSPTSPPHRRDPDVLILGGGVVGLFCAYFLRQAGATVAVAERGAVGGPGSCSSGNIGFVGTHGAAPLAGPGVLGQGLRGVADPGSPFSIRPRLDPRLASWLWQFRRCCDEQAARRAFGVLVELKRRSLDILTGLCAAGPLAATFTAPGIVIACKTQRGFDEACRQLPQAAGHGVPLRVLEPGELAELEPDTRFGIRGALLNAEGAAVSVPGFMRALAGHVTGLGVQVLQETEVTGFEVTGRRVSRVRTTGGEFTPGEVIVAAGAWSASCARQLGVGLHLQPAVGYSVTVKATAGAPRRPVALSEGRVSLLPFGGTLRFGGIMELAGPRARFSGRRVDAIRRVVRGYLPELDLSHTTQTWRGFRPCTPDSLPYLGRVPGLGNASVACGHGSIGMGLAPASGELMAQIVTGQTPSTDPAPFRVGRFGEGGRS